jgi:hypothetical protein
MSKIIVIEALIATPPTSKCEETIEILEELIRRHPDELRLVVFRRGVDFMPPELRLKVPNCEEDVTPKQTSVQMRQLIQKGSAVPCVVVGGDLLSTFEVPNPKELEARVHQILKSTSTK